MKFAHKLVNTHVIDSQQILISILKHGQGVPFSSSFEDREKPTQIAALGKLLSDVSQQI